MYISTENKYNSIKSTNEKQSVFDQFTDLPPTPSSSAYSFLVYEKQDLIDENETIISEQSSYKRNINYGSIDSPSTVSPNDDDENLYLLWTHQLLKERGFNPSPLTRTSTNDSVDSSITNYSTQFNNSIKSWFYSWFPTC